MFKKENILDLLLLLKKKFKNQKSISFTELDFICKNYIKDEYVKNPFLSFYIRDFFEKNKILKSKKVHLTIGYTYIFKKENNLEIIIRKLKLEKIENSN